MIHCRISSLWVSHVVFLSHKVILCIVKSVNDTKHIYLVWIVLKIGELVRETIYKNLSTACFNVYINSFPQIQTSCLSWSVSTVIFTPWARNDCARPLRVALCVPFLCPSRRGCLCLAPHWTVLSSGSARAGVTQLEHWLQWVSCNRVLDG